MTILLDVDVTGRRVVVVGCGRAGQEKLDRLLRAGAHVCVVDPRPPTGLDDRVEVIARAFQASDIDGSWLVVAATGDPSVDDHVQQVAGNAGVWVTRADRSDGGGVSFAATVERGPVRIGVVTGGASPALARWIRDRIAAAVPEQVSELAALLAERPRRAGRRGHRGLPMEDALDALVQGDRERARTLLSDDG